MKKLLALLVAALLIVCASLALAEPVAIKALILPKFESGEMAGNIFHDKYQVAKFSDGGEALKFAEARRRDVEVVCRFVKHVLQNQ